MAVVEPGVWGGADESAHRHVGAAGRAGRSGKYRPAKSRHTARREGSVPEGSGCRRVSPGIGLRGFAGSRPDPVQLLQRVLVQVHRQRAEVRL